MEKQIALSIDNELVNIAIDVLEEIGLDIQSAVKIFLKRIAREKSLSFLLSDSNAAAIKPQHETTPRKEVFTQETVIAPSVRDMTKSVAIRLFRTEGVNLNRNITFASKNRGAYNYWANPEFDMLKNDWYIILNDWAKKELHLFLIPANTIKTSQLTPRNDKDYLVDLQIMYNDNSFSDNRSGYSFAKHLIKQISY